MKTKQICILIFSLALLAAFFGTGFSMQKTMDLSSECCDDACVNEKCEARINKIYHDCGLIMMDDGNKMTESDAEDFCKKDSNWICIFIQSAVTNNCDIGCYEGELNSGCEDFKNDNFCSDLKVNLQEQCGIFTERSGDDDDDEDHCG